MRSANRECLQCGEYFEGRANKKFCTTACRAQHFRENQEGLSQDEEPQLGPSRQEITEHVIRPASNYKPPVRFYEPDEDDEGNPGESWQQSLNRQQESRQKVKEIADIHQRYCQLVTGCLKTDGDALNDEELQTWVEDLDGLSDDYRKHPHLRLSANVVHERLEDVYWLRDRFRRLLDEWHEQSDSWFRSAEPVCFELPSKRRALLRAHLLP